MCSKEANIKDFWKTFYYTLLLLQKYGMKQKLPHRLRSQKIQ